MKNFAYVLNGWHLLIGWIKTALKCCKVPEYYDQGCKQGQKTNERTKKNKIVGIFEFFLRNLIWYDCF